MQIYATQDKAKRLKLGSGQAYDYSSDEVFIKT
jgi:hypothetical protein